MANYKVPIPFHQAWEGGLSRDKNDTASRNPAPWFYKNYNDWHTNKGITFTTFISNASKIGYEPSAENFFTMPNEIWGRIFKLIYWDGLKLDDVKSDAIASALSNWSWGSGVGGAMALLKKYLSLKGYTVTNASQAAQALNELSFKEGEEKIFRELIATREAFFKGLNQPANLKGWLNRLIYGLPGKESMLQFGLNLIKKKRIINITAISLISLVIIITIVMLFKTKK